MYETAAGEGLGACNALGAVEVVLKELKEFWIVAGVRVPYWWRRWNGELLQNSSRGGEKEGEGGRSFINFLICRVLEAARIGGHMGRIAIRASGSDSFTFIRSRGGGEGQSTICI